MGHDINIRNKMNSGKSGAESKLSAKTSNQSQIQSLKQKTNTYQFPNVNKIVNTAVKVGTGNVSGLASAGLMKAGMTGALIATGLASSDKVAKFGIDIWESHTGESMLARNIRASVSTVTSLGGNLLSQAIKNAVIVKNQIERQNLNLEYGRELYNLNVFNEKNKIR